MRPIWPLLLACLIPLATSQTGLAQDSMRHLLRMVPDDFGFVVAAHDLRSQFARWDKSAWLKKISESPLGKALLTGPEWANLTKVKNDLQPYLGVDWPTIRDDIVGDAVVLGYRTPSGGQSEEGLLLVHARKANLLSNLLDRLNTMQKKSGELKELEEKEFEGVKFYRRVHDKSTQYYFVRDKLLVLCGQEATLKTLIRESRDVGKDANVWTRSFERGTTPDSFLTLLINPRAFDAEFKRAGKKGDVFQVKLAEYWSVLDAIALNVRWDESLEVRLALLGNGKGNKEAAKRLFRPAVANPLWTFFPEASILTLTGQVDFTLSDESWGDLLPPEFRKQIIEGLQKSLGALVGLNMERELLPNVGPDWGIAAFASENPKNIPQLVFALAVQPGTTEPPADQALMKGMQFLAGLAMFDYNRNHPDQIRMQTLHQGKIEVKSLVNEKGFPEGFQPSFALKDGYLLLASSPEGILRFRKGKAPEVAKGEHLILRLSASELSKQITARRDFLAEHIAKSNAMGRPAANAVLDGVQAVLALFDRAELAHASAPDQMTVILRVRP